MEDEEDESHKHRENPRSNADHIFRGERVHLNTGTCLVPGGFRFPGAVTAVLHECDESEKDKGENKGSHYRLGRRKS